MSSFVDSVFAFSTVQPQSVGQESVYQWKPSAEQVNVMMAEDNHTQAGIPFQFHVHYQSPAHASASAIVANLQDTSAAPSTYSQGNIDAMESSGIYSHALPVSMSLPTSMPMLLSLPLGTQQKRTRELSVSMAVGVSPSQPIFADDQSADAQRKAKRSRLIREYSNGILTHANMNSQQPASTSNGSGNGDFSGVLDDLSIPILFPDAKPAPLLIPAEDDEFDFLKMNVHDRSPAYSYPYSTTFLFKNVAQSPSSAAALLIAPAANASSSSSSSFASSSPLFAAPALPSISTVSSAYDSQVLSENVESTQVTASRDMLYGYAAPMPMPLAASVSLQQPQPAVPGSLARFLPNSPTHLAIVAAVPNEVKTEAFQPEVQENAHMPALQTAQVNGPAFASVSGAAAGASMITPATTAVSCSATEAGAENVSESAIGCAPSNTPRTLRSHDSRRHSLQQSAAQMHTPTGSDSPFHGQMTPSSPSSGSISSRARRPGSPQHTPSVSAVLHTSSGIAIPPLRLSAARASHRVADGDDSTRAVKQAKRITVDLTKGGVELEVFERYYQRANDGVEYKIRLIRLVNRRSGRSDVYCHAADLGGVVERKSNISRLFGQFESPREKILMNVIGAHSLSIGQESNILTYYGVRRFFDVSKMKGQMHFRRWIETVLLPDLQATTQVSAVQLLPPKNESDAQHMQIAANGQTHAQIHSVHSQAKKENQKNSGVASSRKEAGDESDHELDGPPSLSSDDESSSDSTDDLDDEADE